MSCKTHDYAEDGKCRNCDDLTSGAFWGMIAKGLGMDPKADAVGLRLRPGKEPEFITPHRGRRGRE